ncbi:hypothetical protein LCGC14_0878030 [marine sediment metagenome]|uniref:Uncharacterized protein n=1 Tax=marine sediment metagenome TaxID=412755 RepID=A0A0F9RMB0_9ZZZZ
MPCIICSYCQYVGQQKPEAEYLDYDEMIMDVLAHENICAERPSVEFIELTDKQKFGG